VAEIQPRRPGYYKDPPKNVIDYLKLVSEWHSEFKINEANTRLRLVRNFCEAFSSLGRSLLPEQNSTGLA
jgi:hypothetical protein